MKDKKSVRLAIIGALLIWILPVSDVFISRAYKFSSDEESILAISTIIFLMLISTIIGVTINKLEK